MRYLTTGIVLFAICSLIPFMAIADFTESAQFGTGYSFSIAWGDYDDGGRTVEWRYGLAEFLFAEKVEMWVEGAGE